MGQLCCEDKEGLRDCLRGQLSFKNNRNKASESRWDTAQAPVPDPLWKAQKPSSPGYCSFSCSPSLLPSFLFSFIYCWFFLLPSPSSPPLPPLPGSRLFIPQLSIPYTLNPDSSFLFPHLEYHFCPRLANLDTSFEAHPNPFSSPTLRSNP